MRCYQCAISLCLLALPALPAFAATEETPAPRLVYALVAPAAINLAQESAVPIQVKPVWASGRNFPDTVMLKTDLGHFDGTVEQQVELKAIQYQFPDVKLCFDTLTQAPMQPCHVSLLVEGQEYARASIAIQQATSIRYGASPPWIPLGEKAQPWSTSWYVDDQFGKPLAGVPGLVQYTLPGSPPAAMAGVSDDAGVFRVSLPPAKCEGKFSTRLITATCVSALNTGETQQPDGINYLMPNLVATIAVPKKVVFPLQKDIPVLIYVSSHDGRPLPETIDLYGGGPKMTVPLKQGIGKAFISLHDFPGYSLDILAAIEGEVNGTPRTRPIGRASINVISYPSSMQLSVTPLKQKTSHDPIGILTISVRYGEQPYPRLPVFITHPLLFVGPQYSVRETDEQGIVTFPIPAGGKIPMIHVQPTGQADYVLLEQDDKGRLIAWGHRDDEKGKLKAVETIAYDTDGNPVVAKQPQEK